MANFFKESFQELEHIVWPTDKETRRYLMITVSVIVFMTTFLAILGYIFSNSLTAIRGQFPHMTTSSDSDIATQEDLSNFLNQYATGVTSSGTESSGNTETTASGLTITGSGVEVNTSSNESGTGL